MENENYNQDNTIWPIPQFYFKVDFGEGMREASFTEVSGLDVEAQTIDYRHGNSPVFSTIKMPGLKKTGNVTLKKGLLIKDEIFFTWLDGFKLNTIQRKNITISLMDEQGKPTMVWTLQNAWPVKISVADLNSAANEVAVETIEIAHEGLIVANS